MKKNYATKVNIFLILHVFPVYSYYTANYICHKCVQTNNEKKSLYVICICK